VRKRYVVPPIVNFKFNGTNKTYSQQDFKLFYACVSLLTKGKNDNDNGRSKIVLALANCWSFIASTLFHYIYVIQYLNPFINNGCLKGKEPTFVQNNQPFICYQQGVKALNSIYW
jgi:hypothetical protein